MDIFSYLQTMICIRDKQCTPIVTPKMVESSDKKQVHKKVLAKFFAQGSPVVFVFENELYLSRAIDDIANNEIKTFVTTNNTWDILVLSAVSDDIVKLPVDNYTFMKKLQDDKTFNESYIYIASARFAQKMNDPNASIETYVYDRPFVKNLTVDHSSNKFVIGQITNITELNQVEIKYTWSEVEVAL